MKPFAQEQFSASMAEKRRRSKKDTVKSTHKHKKIVKNDTKIEKNIHEKYISIKIPKYFLKGTVAKILSIIADIYAGPQLKQDGGNNKMAANITILMYKNNMK